MFCGTHRETEHLCGESSLLPLLVGSRSHTPLARFALQASEPSCWLRPCLLNLSLVVCLNSCISSQIVCIFKTFPFCFFSFASDDSDVDNMQQPWAASWPYTSKEISVRDGWLQRKKVAGEIAPSLMMWGGSRIGEKSQFDWECRSSYL